MIMMVLSIEVAERLIDKQTIFASCVAIFIGFLLKVTKDWSNNVLDFKKFIIQGLFSFGIGYFSFIYSTGKEWDGIYKQLFIGFMSFVSAETVSAVETMAKDGIKKYLASKLNAILAKKTDDKKDI